MIDNENLIKLANDIIVIESFKFKGSFFETKTQNTMNAINGGVKNVDIILKNFITAIFLTIINSAFLKKLISVR